MRLSFLLACIAALAALVQAFNAGCAPVPNDQTHALPPPAAPSRRSRPERTPRPGDLDRDDDSVDYVFVGCGPTGVIAAIDTARSNRRWEVVLLCAADDDDYDPALPEYATWLTDDFTLNGPYPVRGNPANRPQMTTPLLGDTFAARNPQSYPDVLSAGGGSAINAGAYGTLSSDWIDSQAAYVNDFAAWNATVVALKRAQYFEYLTNDPTKLNTPQCSHGLPSGTAPPAGSPPRMHIDDLLPEATGGQFIQSASIVQGVPLVDFMCHPGSQGAGTMTRALKPNMTATKTHERWERQQMVRKVLLPALGLYSNLRLIDSAWATRLIRHPGDTRRIRGLYYVQRGREMKIHARKEVVLAMGTRGVPHFLMLNGIGPRPVLEDVGLTVHYEQPNIGRHWQDGLGTQSVWACPYQARQFDSITQLAFVSAADRALNITLANMEIATVQAGSIPGVISYLIVLNKANVLRSEGTVGIKSGAGFLNPYLTYTVTDADLDLQCEVLNASYRIMAHVAMQGYFCFQIPDSPTFGVITCDEFKARSRASPTATQLDYHDVGTVRAGKPGDTSAAVDSRGHFDGMSGLRVIGTPLYQRCNDRHAGFDGAVVGGWLGAHWIRMDNGIPDV